MESQKVMMQKNTLRVKATSDNAKRMEESLITEVRSLLVAGPALSVSRKQLQVTSFLCFFIWVFFYKWIDIVY